MSNDKIINEFKRLVSYLKDQGDTLKESGDKIPEEKKKPIEDALTELKAAHAAKDIATIDTAMEKLNTAFQAASQDMYNATQNSDPGAPEGNANPQEEKKDEEVTDVDFEEV